MSTFFSGDEVIRIAVKTEETGYKFYKLAYSNTKSDRLKNIFNYLAEQELKHKEIFLSFKGLIKELPQGVPVDWDELDLYIKALTDSSFFLGEDKNINLASKATDDKEAIDFAIGFEKDTMLYFYQIRDLLKNPEKPIIDKVINEEKEHIKKLLEIKKSIL
jgi:rubrerythrin